MIDEYYPDIVIQEEAPPLKDGKGWLQFEMLNVKHCGFGTILDGKCPTVAFLMLVHVPAGDPPRKFELTN